MSFLAIAPSPSWRFWWERRAKRSGQRGETRGNPGQQPLCRFLERIASSLPLSPWMPRRGRLVVPEVAHHVTQRGNNRQVVFDSDFDRQLFLDLLADYAPRHRLSILGFCLMSNHFHLVAVPEREDSLARTIGRLEADYARYLNVRRRTAGHLWQARFFSVPMEPRYGAIALAYVERNPVRAGMVDVAEEYPWSSAGARLGLREPPGWLELANWKQEWSAREWRELLRDPRQEEPFRLELRDATMAGLPLGEGLRRQLEERLGKRLRPGKAGRPPKQAPADAGSRSGAGEVPLFGAGSAKRRNVIRSSD